MQAVYNACTCTRVCTYMYMCITCTHMYTCGIPAGKIACSTCLHRDSCLYWTSLTNASICPSVPRRESSGPKSTTTWNSLDFASWLMLLLQLLCLQVAESVVCILSICACVVYIHVHTCTYVLHTILVICMNGHVLYTFCTCVWWYLVCISKKSVNTIVWNVHNACNTLSLFEH